MSNKATYYQKNGETLLKKIKSKKKKVKRKT